MLRMAIMLLAAAAIALPVEAAAAELWWTYTASYDGLPGAIRLDLNLIDRVPVTGYPYLLVAGTTYSTTQYYGVPEPADLERLNALSAKVVAAVKAKTPSIHAGTFTYDSRRSDYIYMKDKTGIDKLLAGLYAQACKGCKTSIDVRPDPSWSVYRAFLFPNAATREFYKAELKKLGFASR